MKFLKPLSIIFACTFAGELMRYTIPLPVPANIYGILLLFLLLVTKIVPLSRDVYKRQASRQCGKFNKYIQDRIS